MINFYLPGTMHVDMSIKSMDITKANQFFFHKNGVDIKNISDKSIDEIYGNSLISSIQEHEFFHHRHSCSSTYGYFAFVLQSISLSYRSEIAKNIYKPASDIEDFKINSFDKAKLNNPFYYNMAKHCSIELFMKCFEGLDGKCCQNIINNDDNLQEYLAVTIPQTDKSQSENKLLHSTPKTIDLIEAIATWKQFNWLSLVWLVGQTSHLQELEKKWLSWLSKNNPAYLSTANYIYSRTGIALRNSLFGIIIDLALNPPLFTDGKFSWEEISPQLRLEAILNACAKLPRKIIEKDYLELITAEEYQSILDLLEGEIGWKKSADNTTDALKHIDKSIKSLKEIHGSPKKGTIEYSHKHFHSKLVLSYLAQFNNAMLNHAAFPGCMLFPWLSKVTEFTGNLIRPIATQYYDKLSINILRIEGGLGGNKGYIYDPVGVWIILEDMAENIWLYETINQNAHQKEKIFARKFYNSIPDAISSHFNYSRETRKMCKRPSNPTGQIGQK